MMSSEEEDNANSSNSDECINIGVARRNRNLIVDSEDEDDASSASKKKLVKTDSRNSVDDSGVIMDEESSSQDDDSTDGDEDYEESDSSENEGWEDDNGAEQRENGGEIDSDQSDGQSDKCPICLNRFRGQDMGIPESCDHVFCLECIQEWARKVNTCPVDRQVFNLILVRKEWEGKIVHRIPVNESLDGEGEEDEELTYCEVCGRCDREDRLLLCDACDLGYHCECLDPPLNAIPVEEWFCPDCQPLRNPAATEAMEEVGELLANNFRPVAAGRRVIARTRASEMVRSRIERRRLAEGLNDDTPLSQRVPPTRPRTILPRRRRRTRKRRVYRRKKSTKGSATKKGSTGSTKPRKAKRTRRRKCRRTARSRRTSRPLAPAASVKGRIANVLGLRKPPPGQTIPIKVKSGQGRSFSRSADTGPSFSIFGDRQELPHFEDSYGYDPVEDGGGAAFARVVVPRQANANLKKAVAVYKRGVTIPRVPFSVSAPSVSTSGGLDILGSILENQRLLHSANSNNSKLPIQAIGSQKMDKKQIPNGEVRVQKRPLDPSSSSSPATNGSGKSSSRGNSSPSHSTASQMGQRSYSIESDWSTSLNINSRRSESNDLYGNLPALEATQCNNEGRKKAKAKEQKASQSDDDIDIYSDIETISNEDEENDGELFPVTIHETNVKIERTIQQQQPHHHHHEISGPSGCPVTDSSDDELVIDEGEAPHVEKAASFELESISDPDVDMNSGDNGPEKTSSGDEARHEYSESAASPDEIDVGEESQPPEDYVSLEEESKAQNDLKQQSLKDEEDIYDASQDEDYETEIKEPQETDMTPEYDNDEDQIPEEDEPIQEDCEDDPTQEEGEDDIPQDDGEEDPTQDDCEDDPTQDDGEDDVISARVESPISEAEEQLEEEDEEVEEESKETSLKPTDSQNYVSEEKEDAKIEDAQFENILSNEKLINSDQFNNVTEEQTDKLENEFARIVTDGVEDISDDASEDNALDYSEDIDENEAPVISNAVMDVVETEEAEEVEESGEDICDEKDIVDNNNDDDDDDDHLVDIIQEICEEDIKLVKSDVEDLEEVEPVAAPIETLHVSPPARPKTPQKSCPKRKSRSTSSSITNKKPEQNSSSNSNKDKKETDIWKKPSQSTRERSYRDGKPRDDKVLFRQRELKEDEDDRRQSRRREASKRRREEELKKDNRKKETRVVSEKSSTERKKEDRHEERRDDRRVERQEERRDDRRVERHEERSHDERQDERKKDDKRCKKERHRSCDKHEHSTSKGEKEKDRHKSRATRHSEKPSSSNKEKDSKSSKHASNSRSVSKRKTTPTDTYFDYYKFGDNQEDDLHYMYDDPDLLPVEKHKDRNVRKVDDKIIVEKRGKHSKKDKQERKLREEVYQSIQPAGGTNSKDGQSSPELSDVESKEIISKDGSIIINVNYNRNKESSKAKIDVKIKEQEEPIEETKPEEPVEEIWNETEMQDPQSPQPSEPAEDVSTKIRNERSLETETPVSNHVQSPQLSNHVKRPRIVEPEKNKNRQHGEQNKSRKGPHEPGKRKIRQLPRLKVPSDEKRPRPEVITISESDEEQTSPRNSHPLIASNITPHQDASNASSSVSEPNSNRVPETSSPDSKPPCVGAPYSPPSDSLNFSGMFNKRQPRSPSPPSPMENESYDPCDPTRSPSTPRSPKEVEDSKRIVTEAPVKPSDPKPPPSPERPPLPPEPEPQSNPPPKIFSPLPVLQTQVFPSQPAQFLPSPTITTAQHNQMVPQHFIGHRLPAQGPLPIVTSGLQSLQGLQGLQWSLGGGPATMLFTADANQMQHFLGHQMQRLPHHPAAQQLGGLMPPPGSNSLQMLHPLRHHQPHIANSPLLPTPTIVGHPNNVGSILHRQMAMPDITQPPPPIMSGMHQMRRGPDGSGAVIVSSVPMVPVTVISQQQAQMHSGAESISGKINDALDVVDMEVDSPYSPADSGGGGNLLDEPDSPDSYKAPSKSSPTSKNSAPPPKDAFDALLAAVPKLLEDKRTRDLLVAGAAKVSKLSRNRGSPKRGVSEGGSNSRKHHQGADKGGKQFGESRTRHKKKHHGAKKEVSVKLNESQLKIIDDLPSSAVEMQVKEKFLKKLNRQERVVEEVKLSLKPFYNKRDISKEDYKAILRKCVPKICHNKSGEINPVKIKAMVDTYVKKYRHLRKKGPQKGNSSFES